MGFIGKFSWQAKVSRFKVVFNLAIFFFDLIKVSVQEILFPLNLVLRLPLTFFSMKNKRSSQAMLILLILTLRDKFDILLQ